jgi:hypothetical protein
MNRNPRMRIHLLNLFRETNQRSLSPNDRDFVNLKSNIACAENNTRIPAAGRANEAAPIKL